tara:strand:+ start:566 stop:1036 length:471 start_codon:yes stop_codon:yes gene_type:complete
LKTFRKLNTDDNKILSKLISTEGFNYAEFLNIGWSEDQINEQLNKTTNFSYGIIYNDSLISFILGDLFNIEKISEYEILLIYVCKNFRNQGLGTKLLKKTEENIKCLKKIYLEVAKNNTEAVSFYKKMNFKIFNSRKNYYLIENKKIEALLMSKNY